MLGFVFQYHACVCAQLCLWTVAHQTPLSMGFSRQEYWSVSLSPPGDLPNPGMSPITPAFAGGFFMTEPPRKPTVMGDYIQVAQAERILPGKKVLRPCVPVH